MTKADWLKNQDFTLSLTSGFFGFFAHTGFVKALTENKITPKMITGSSAGALVAACLASGMSADEIAHVFISLRKEDFWDVSFGFGILKGEKMEKLLEKYVCSDFSQLKIPVQISVFDVFSMKTKTLNSGSVAKACRASCAVPVLFQPVKIDNRVYLDGGIKDKMAISGLKTSELILCHYLESDTKSDFFEIGVRIGKKYSNLHKFQLKNIPRSGPYHLHLASEIIEKSYQQTKAWLESDQHSLHASASENALEMPVNPMHA